jgi:hypothetical protein
MFWSPPFNLFLTIIRCCGQNPAIYKQLISLIGVEESRDFLFINGNHSHTEYKMMASALEDTVLSSSFPRKSMIHGLRGRKLRTTSTCFRNLRRSFLRFCDLVDFGLSYLPLPLCVLTAIIALNFEESYCDVSVFKDNRIQISIRNHKQYSDTTRCCCLFWSKSSWVQRTV